MESYDVTEQCHDEHLLDANPRNKYDMEKALSQRLVPRPSDTFDSYEVTTDGQEDEGSHNTKE